MQPNPQELISLVLGALPEAALIVNRSGEVLLRNGAADWLLPAGRAVHNVLHATIPAEIDWQSEMQALDEGAGRLVRRSVHLTGRGNRQLRVHLHLRSMGVCLVDWARGNCQPGEPGADAPAGPAAPGHECVLVLLEDVAPRVSTERRLAASERLAATGSLAAKVAHELNSPLDGVLRYIGLAERVAGEAAGEYLAQARAGLVRMAEIIRSMLDEGRPWQAAGERAAVGRLLDEAVTAMQPRAEALGVAVVSDVDGQVNGVVGGAMLQVFCNVIKNALDAMPNGGLLRICLRPAGGACVVEFADTGCGLTDQEAGRVFEPFYTTKAPGEGSGLGLAICREIVTRAGGSMTVVPRAEGGALVAVRLPCRPPREAPTQEDRP